MLISEKSRIVTYLFSLVMWMKSPYPHHIKKSEKFLKRIIFHICWIIQSSMIFILSWFIQNEHFLIVFLPYEVADFLVFAYWQKPKNKPLLKWSSNILINQKWSSLIVFLRICTVCKNLWILILGIPQSRLCHVHRMKHMVLVPSVYSFTVFRWKITTKITNLIVVICFENRKLTVVQIPFLE